MNAINRIGSKKHEAKLLEICSAINAAIDALDANTEGFYSTPLFDEVTFMASRLVAVSNKTFTVLENPVENPKA